MTNDSRRRTTLANQLRPVLLRLARELRREVHSLGVTGGQVSLLAPDQEATPGSPPPSSPSASGCRRPACPGHVARLETAGLIERTRAADRRRIGLTRHRRGRARAPLGAQAPHRLARRAPERPDRRASAIAIEAAIASRSRSCSRRGADDGCSQLASRRTFARLRRHRNYRLFFAGQLASVGRDVDAEHRARTGSSSSSPRTRAASPSALLSICRFGPFTLLGLLAGVVTDRFDNRRTVIVTQSVQMIFSAVLAAITLLGHVQLWQIYVIAALTGTALVFDAPSRQNLTFQMVGRDELPNAIALNSSLFNTARIFGPALAGVVIAAVGAGWCFAINTVSFLAVLAACSRCASSELYPLARPHAGRRSGAARARASRYARRNRTVQGGPRDDGRVRVDLLQLQHPAAAAREGDARRRPAHVRHRLGVLRRRRADRRAARARRWRGRAGACMLVGAAGFGADRAADRAGALDARSPARCSSSAACSSRATRATRTRRSSSRAPTTSAGRVLGLYYYAWNGLRRSARCSSAGSATAAGPSSHSRCRRAARRSPRPRGGYYVLRRRSEQPVRDVRA